MFIIVWPYLSLISITLKSSGASWKSRSTGDPAAATADLLVAAGLRLGLRWTSIVNIKIIINIY